jgi:hypothetical protein
MHFISTSKTSGLVIGNGKKLSTRMKSGTDEEQRAARERAERERKAAEAERARRME